MTRPKIIILSMLKNEMDILPLWLNYHSHFADAFYLVDHLSADGSFEYLRNQSPTSVKLFSYQNPGYYQSEVFTKTSKIIVEAEGPCWMVPLDVDEFIQPNAESFRLFLSQQNPREPIKLPWLNAVPLHVEKFWKLNSLDLFLESPHSDRNCGKTVFHSDLVNLPGFWVGQGAHAIGQTGKELMPSSSQWLLTHLPIRSESQFLAKVFQGIVAYQKKGATQKGYQRKNAQGFHWYQMANSIIENPKNLNAIIRSYVMNYSQNISKLKPTSIESMLLENWQAVTLFKNVVIPEEKHLDHSNLQLFVEEATRTSPDQTIQQLGQMILSRMKE